MNDAVLTSSGPAKPSGKVRWIVCGLLFAAVVLSYIDRLVLGVVSLEIDVGAVAFEALPGHQEIAV